MRHLQLTAVELARLEACSSEPIRTPGSIQPHGALLAVDRDSGRVVVASENVADFFGADASVILSSTIHELVGADRVPALLDAAENGRPVNLDVQGRRYDAIVHREGPVDFLELEPRADVIDRESAATVYSAAHRIAAERDRAGVLSAAVGEFSALAGFDRTMIYSFHPDGHGEVVAEVHAAGMEPYLGLHFPASDIPAQARDLYLTKLSRAIVSTVTPNVPLLGLTEVGGEKLDLSSAELRSVSPFHLQFMRNMGQASTVSFSLIHQGELIGMVTCAHNTERRISFFLRRSLEVLATQVAIQLGDLSRIHELDRKIRAQDLRAELLGKIIASDDISGALLSGDFTLLDVIPADAAIISLDGVVTCTTGAPDAGPWQATLRELGESVHTDALSLTHPALAGQLAGFAGLLFIPLRKEGDYLAFLRREVLQSIDWLGDLTAQNREEVLSPRLSFSSWRESVTGRSLPWGYAPDAVSTLAIDIESALVRRHDSRLATLAMVDPLTGLANRRFLLNELTARSSTVGSVSMMFIDLDEFKLVNDTLGHEAGDQVITTVGKRLLGCCRIEDLVVRLGGDEFVVVGYDLGPDEAWAMAERIAASLRLPIALDRGMRTVTASIGIVTSASTANPAGLLESADAAMYRAKQSGKDRISA